MQEKTKGRKNLYIALAVIIIIAVAGYFYASRDRSSDILLVSSPAGENVPVDSDLLSALQSLRKLKLDDSLFKSPLWISFTDFGQVIAPEPLGRPNPFAPFDATSTRPLR
jgi:hypothetical protein